MEKQRLSKTGQNFQQKRINFARLKKLTIKEQMLENNKEDEIPNKNCLVNIQNTGELNIILNDFIFKDQKFHHENFSTETELFEKTKYASIDSFRDFYHKAAKYQEMKRKDKIEKITPSVAFIEACRTQKITPNPLIILKKEGKEGTVNLRNYRIGDNYMNSLSQSLKFSSHIHELHLGGNRLTPKSINPLFSSLLENPSNLYKKIEILDLSYNLLDEENVDKLNILLKNPECDIRELNLEGNNLGDKLIIKICESMIKGIIEKIQILNLSRNKITDFSANAIGEFCELAQAIRNLILSWNSIKSYGAGEIVSKLKKNRYLRMLDLSWNSIGNCYDDIGKNLLAPNLKKKEETVVDKKKKEKPKNEKNKEKKPEMKNFDVYDFIQTHGNFKKLSLVKKNSQNNILSNGTSHFAIELGEYFKSKDVELSHLDISHNNINLQDSEYISEKVKENHTILGIHLDGNEMTIDELGFIHPLTTKLKEQNFYANSQIYYEIEKENSLKTKINAIRKIKAKNNCWICEGWREKEFRFQIPNDFNIQGNQVIVELHLNFDNFKPTQMVSLHGSYIATRMCPPGDILYFFSVNEEIFYSEGHGIHLQELKEPIKYVIERKNGYDEDVEDIKIEHVIDKLCQYHILPASQHGKNYNYNKKLNCIPRPEKKLLKNPRPKTPWSFLSSIWNAYELNYEGDTEEYLNDVFEYDFERISKKRDKVDEEYIECKELLRSYYRKIIDTYKYYSSLFGSSNWQISENYLNEFFSLSCQGLIDKKYNINYVFLKKEEAVSSDREDKKRNRIPDNIIRHQFMNLLVKVAKDKYITNQGKFKSLIDAVQFAFQEHYLPSLTGYDNHNWRKERYYNEQMDNFMKAHLPVLNAIFNSWAQKKEIGKKELWMNLEEFNSLSQRIVDSDFPAREIPIYFNQSIRLQINEVDFDRHFQMFFPEFLEGLSRVVDKSSPAPPGQPIEEWDMERRNTQDLVTKYENIIEKFSGLITNPDYKLVKEKFVYPIKDMDTYLYIYDKKNSFYQNLPIARKIYFERAIGKKTTKKLGTQRPTLAENIRVSDFS